MVNCVPDTVRMGMMVDAFECVSDNAGLIRGAAIAAVCGHKARHRLVISAREPALAAPLTSTYERKGIEPVAAQDTACQGPGLPSQTD